MSGFHCEMRAMHGPRCRGQCVECEDVDPRFAPEPRGVPPYTPTEEQPARCGGTEA